jgi:hypothetical protein
MIQPKLSRYWSAALIRGRGTNLLSARWLAAAVTASSLISGASLIVPVSAALAQTPSSACEEAAGIAVLPTPVAPWQGMPLRVIFTAAKPITGELSLVAPDGSVAASSRERHDGPPYFWYAEVATPAAGMWRAKLARDGMMLGDCAAITRDITVSSRQPPRPHGTPGAIWGVHNSWNRATEDLYSAWIAKLFDAPVDAEPAWKAWHEVLRDRSRNVLFNYLGLSEDNMVNSVRPDCADFVYFLRAYFAFKLGLPFGYSNCSRGGTSGAPPKCYEWFDVLRPERTRPAPPPSQSIAAAGPLPMLMQPAAPTEPKWQPYPASFGQYLRIVGDVVHTGSVRTPANEDNNDFYTVPLNEDSLRPGTVYADPYGHVLMLVRRVPEANGNAGIFLAVDAEPDGSITRKRFWRGNFLFVHDPALGGPGFKRFRPIVRQANGALRRLTNAEIAKNPQYGDFSLEQSQISLENFYDRMDDVMSPEPLDPVRAMQGAITSLEEQVKTRATAVENGRKWQAGAREAEMPNGPSIFETSGAWEDFSTPARDLRLLIAIDVVRGYPDRVVRRSDRYAMPLGKSAADVKAELQRVLASELASRKFTYTRSEGSAWTLSLKDVLDRMQDLEMGYNPNDCVELRWGAPANSEEAATCRRHAPAAQRAKMASEYRAWFRERRWPTHA